MEVKNCDIQKEVIGQLLLEKEIPAKELYILSDDTIVKRCEGVYILLVTQTKDKSSLLCTYPLLVVNNKYFLNGRRSYNYLNREEKEIVSNELAFCLKKTQVAFSKKELKQIMETYKKGVTSRRMFHSNFRLRKSKM
jgi:hypothetical protein